MDATMQSLNNMNTLLGIPQSEPLLYLILFKQKSRHSRSSIQEWDLLLMREYIILENTHIQILVLILQVISHRIRKTKCCNMCTLTRDIKLVVQHDKSVFISTNIYYRLDQFCKNIYSD